MNKQYSTAITRLPRICALIFLALAWWPLAAVSATAEANNSTATQEISVAGQQAPINEVSNNEEKPLWELGVGVVGVSYPDYLGADERSVQLLPLPYIRYRGESLRADQDGFRGLIYDGERLDINLSFGGSLPVKSDNNRAREGMDDLDLLLETGPNIEYTLWHNDDARLRFDLPLRGAFSLGSDVLRHQGWVSNPRLYYTRNLGDQRQLRASFGPLFGDSRYHGYIYEVGPKDVTAGRHLYQAKSGYSGTRTSIILRQQRSDWMFGATFSYIDLNGAANDDSPLFRDDEYAAAGLFVSWIFAESKVKKD